MGRKQVNKVTLGSPSPLTAASVRKAVQALKAYNVMDTMMTGFYSTALLSRLEASTWLVKDLDDRPDWIQKLEKEWGIR